MQPKREVTAFVTAEISRSSSSWSVQVERATTTALRHPQAKHSWKPEQSRPNKSYDPSKTLLISLSPLPPLSQTLPPTFQSPVAAPRPPARISLKKSLANVFLLQRRHCVADVATTTPQRHTTPTACPPPYAHDNCNLVSEKTRRYTDETPSTPSHLQLASPPSSGALSTYHPRDEQHDDDDDDNEEFASSSLTVHL